jgi:predicted nuclease of predicted toxin-antitoxin system
MRPSANGGHSESQRPNPVRLLFDEQLSEALSTLLRDLFPDSLHVRQLGAGGAADEALWQLAKDRNCLLVTKDEDFHRLSVLRGAPPKVIWLRVGNCTTEDIARLLRQHLADLRAFDEHAEAALLELG